MIEWYRAYEELDAIIDDTEQLVAAVVLALTGDTRVSAGEGARSWTVDVAPPWRRLTVRDAMAKFVSHCNRPGRYVTTRDYAGIQAFFSRTYLFKGDAKKAGPMSTVGEQGRSHVSDGVAAPAVGDRDAARSMDDDALRVRHSERQGSVRRAAFVAVMYDEANAHALRGDQLRAVVEVPPDPEQVFDDVERGSAVRLESHGDPQHRELDDVAQRHAEVQWVRRSIELCRSHEPPRLILAAIAR